MTRRSTTPWLMPALLGTAAALGTSALYAVSKAREAERRTPPIGDFMTVDGVRLHYIVRGHGQPLVLIHGNGTMIQDFLISGIVDELAKRYRVIIFDRPGYGYSSRPRGLWTPRAHATLYEKALERLGVSKAVVLGHSWGSLVAVALALQAPGLVRSLVLASGYYYPTLRADVILASPPAIPGLGDVLRYTVSPLLTRLLWPAASKRVFSPMQVSERFKRFPTWMALRPKQLRAAAAETALMIPAAASLAKRYPELKVPVVVVAGTGDKIVDSGHNSERLNERLADSQLQLQPGVGHMTHYAHPEKVMAAIDEIAAHVGERVHMRTPQAEALARASESGV